MSPNEQPYTLENMGNGEWRFRESELIRLASTKFDDVLATANAKGSVGSKVRAFILNHPEFMDAFCQYAVMKIHERRPIDALVFAQTAVATGQRAFTPEFIASGGILPTGWVTNRPFLRAMNALMRAQWDAGLRETAVMTGEDCLRLDPEDRNGVRLILPIYYLSDRRTLRALALFESKRYYDTFGTAAYLYALSLFELKGADAARGKLGSCLFYYPQVARFILEWSAPAPTNESRFGGVISGSEFEGWVDAHEFGWLWRRSADALAFLSNEAAPYAARNWRRGDNGPTSSVSDSPG